MLYKIRIYPEETFRHPEEKLEIDHSRTLLAGERQ